VVIGPWTSHVCMTAQDHHGMGCWSSIEFEGRNARRIVIVTGYRSCNQQARLGSSTFHDQQYRILLNKGITRPNPHEQFLDDLITQVGQWRQSHKAVLLCLDANDDVTSTTSMQGLACILVETNLVDLHHLRYPTTPCPPTYNCGTLTIDTCLGSPEFASSLAGNCLHTAFWSPGPTHGRSLRTFIGLQQSDFIWPCTTTSQIYLLSRHS